MTANDFTWYTNALKGERGPISADDPEPGFYENRRKDRQTGKVTRDLVAYWHDSNDGTLRCHRNGRDVEELNAREMWPYASKYPIPEQTYRDVTAGKPWPDEAASLAAPADDDADLTPAEKIIAEIAKAKLDRKNYDKIDSDEQAGRAQSLRSSFTTLAGKLDKEREALVRPHLDAQRDINAQYNPTINDAKAEANTIRTALEKWEEDKREARRLAEEAAKKIADEANAAPLVQSNVPAPAAQIRGGGGRAASVGTYNEVIIDDEAAVYAHLKGAPELTALILTLAQKAVNAGLTVPGTHTVERVKIR